MGDTWCVPWREGGNGGTVSQVTVLVNRDEKLHPGDWWVVSRGSNREGGKKGKKGKKGKGEKEPGTFRLPRELLFCTPEEAAAHHRAAMAEAWEDGDHGDDDGGRDDNKGEGGDKGDKGCVEGVTRGLGRKGTRGVRRG